MEIPPLPARTQHASDRTTTVSARALDPEKAAPVPTTPPVAGDGISVVTGIHEGTGALTTTMVDAGSGDVIAQIPASQVLDLVAHLIDLNRQRNEERKDHGEH